MHYYIFSKFSNSSSECIQESKSRWCKVGVHNVLWFNGRAYMTGNSYRLSYSREYTIASCENLFTSCITLILVVRTGQLYLLMIINSTVCIRHHEVRTEFWVVHALYQLSQHTTGCIKKPAKDWNTMFVQFAFRTNWPRLSVRKQNSWHLQSNW